MNKTSVDFGQPSCYQSPRKGSWRALIQHYKLWLAYRYYRRLLKRLTLPIPAGKTSPIILDVGCGTGSLIGFLEKWISEAQYVEVEHDYRLLKDAATRFHFRSLFAGTRKSCHWQVILSRL